ncbi:hypothetical protein ACFLQR_02410 [Verrucomicrobiota bacterium]
MTWTKSQIRQARKIKLAPLLKKRGLQLKPLPSDNFLVADHYDLLVKKSYWRWPSRDIEGNAIDYFMLVEGKSFNQTMQILSSGLSNEASAKSEATCANEDLSSGQNP